jgi:hypothetical protein
MKTEAQEILEMAKGHYLHLPPLKNESGLTVEDLDRVAGEANVDLRDLSEKDAKKLIAMLKESFDNADKHNLESLFYEAADKGLMGEESYFILTGLLD